MFPQWNDQYQSMDSLGLYCPVSVTCNPFPSFGLIQWENSDNNHKEMLEMQRKQEKVSPVRPLQLCANEGFVITANKITNL